MVWSMKQKRNPLGDIIKHKARLCVGGHKSIPFVDYWDTFAPVISWPTVRLIFTLALVSNWHIHSIDIILAYPQADIKTDIFLQPLRVPFDFPIPDLPNPLDHLTKVYKLIKNLYGLKDAGNTWFQHLESGLVKRGWHPSSINKCLYFKDNMLLLVYVNDACIIFPDKSAIDKKIKSLQRDYTLTNDDELQDYLGTLFIRNPNGSVTLTQPCMLARLFKLLNIDPANPNTKRHDIPATEVLDHNPTNTPR